VTVSPEVAGWGCVALTLGVALAASWVARRRGAGMRPTAGVWLLVVAHPGIWMVPEGVDGGEALVQSALVFTMLAVGGGFWAAYRPLPIEPDSDAP